MPRQDKQQKDERDEDERDEDERDEDESDDDSDEDEDERDEAKAGAKSADDDDSDDDDDDEAEDDEPDEAAQRVAKALGVAEEKDDGDAKEATEGEGAESTEAEAEAAAAKPNRAQRRREEALARRKKRSGAGASAAEDVSTSKDKNARAKELLKRRREQAASDERAAPGSNQLDAGEMVDDALARSASAIGKWLRNNLQAIQLVILASVLGVGGYMFYASRVEKTAAEASAKLAAGVAADRGIVTLEEDKRSDDDKEANPIKVFKSSDEQIDAELKAFSSVIEQHAGSGAALLAKLGQGGAYLEKKDYDKAIAAYADVLASPLAAADPDVKGRAIEGTAFAKEGKGDLDGALSSFKELGSIDLKGYKELATYHEARVTFAKGDKAKAKELLEPLNNKLGTPTQEPLPTSHLKSAVSDLLAQIDPSATAAPPKPPPGAKMPTPEEIQDMARRATEALKNKAPAPQAPKDEKTP